MDSILLNFHRPTSSETLDFGRIVQHSPTSVLKPNTPEDISSLLKTISSSSRYNSLTVAARGAGHSIHGQAHALDGIVIDMTSLPKCIRIGKTKVGSDQKDCFFVDVGGGVLWVEVLVETLKHGLAPRSWTDYLFLTVGGTLSVGGISGQTFKYGPQICNVLEMDVITGRGDILTCSKDQNSELFHGVLGGLGQFGIIIRARVILETAPEMVRCVRLTYNDFSKFTGDQERLISMKEVDYVEGFMKLSCSENKPLDHLSFIPSISGSTESNVERRNVAYTIEMAMYYNGATDAQQLMDQVLSRLSTSVSAISSLDVSYFDFLNRVRQEELRLRSIGLWEVPHPWLNMFVPKSQITAFHDLLLNVISSTPINGPILIYPMLRCKWNPKMFVILPRDDVDGGEYIFYAVGLLRSAVPPSCLQTLLNQNQKIIIAATSRHTAQVNRTGAGNYTTSAKGEMRLDEESEEKVVMGTIVDQNHMGAKQYIPYYRDDSEWKDHFGEHWERFVALKSKFDPLNILSPGQMIFRRKRKEV
ncbi:PREDICTED: cytokinin dehydrogenase 3-like [Nelumbo nucifera]|uniref:cytokinin dehydrogenase n=2 Tax=Nelumbo nucifera TaxID=4432 RepID=A0A1U7ZHE0_NELNU|nr:PREDICTED: cytokinin dehydrogenase 3-like [Nelumbo nucifera]XP_010247028.1 PREDICTED: cytokinin dehydrogenase 3-like [Nelumbo nucifera]DAD20648.1 TPA_asm: hypothetical protein HUJ06_022111 [Nelumbo nucifera]